MEKAKADALLLAACMGNPGASGSPAEEARRAIGLGADAAGGAKKGSFLLHAVCMAEDAVPVLIEAGADPRARSPGGVPILHYAAGSGDAALCSVLIKGGADPSDADPEGRTSLHNAAAHGAGVETMRVLLSAGALVDAADSGGLTALHYAAREGNLPEVEALLAAGADTDARGAGGHTASEIASPPAASLIGRARAERERAALLPLAAAAPARGRRRV